MSAEAAGVLRLYVNGDDRYGGLPLYEAMVKRWRELGLAGASVFRSEMGFGQHGVIHDSTSEYTFLGSPVVVELVDVEEQLQRLLAECAGMVLEGLVITSTVSPARLMRSVSRTE